MVVLNPIKRRQLLAWSGAFLLAAQAGSSLAQPAYPERPIRLYVGYSAGGGVDAMARMLAPRLLAELGQQIIVDNRAGASGTIAGDAAARSAPDGYTLMLGDSSLLIAKFMQPTLAFDPLTAFAPVAGLFTLPLVIVANNDFPARDAKELINALKAKPAAYSYGSSGLGTVQHLGMEMFKAQTGTSVLHVPYRGASQIIPDVIGGQIQLGVVSATAAAVQSKAGKLRALAVMSDDRLPGLEGIGPLSAAVPGFEAAPRLFLLAPAGTPQPVVQRLSEAVRKIMGAPDMVQTAALQGAVPAYLPPAALADSIRKESARWGQLVREQDIKPQ